MSNESDAENSSELAKTKTDPSEDNLFQSIWDSIAEKQTQGDLGLSILLIVIVYNLLVFELSPGREIYVFFPVILLIGGYYSKYWENETKGIIRKIGVALLIVAFVWDLFVSITFIPNGNGSYSLESLPTIVLDLLGVISLIVWTRRKANGSRNVKIDIP